MSGSLYRFCTNSYLLVALALMLLPPVTLVGAESDSASESSAVSEGVPQNRVLVIGIDGTRADALLAAETPNLDSLIAGGRLWRNTQILGDRPTENDTSSGPGWTSFLTGVWADKHGINDNSFEGKNVEEYPHFFARVRQQFPHARIGSFVDWQPIDEHLVRDADVRVCEESHGVDQYRISDKKLADAASQFLATGQPHVAMVYFGAADEAGHSHGFHPSVPEYKAAIEKIDQHIGQVLDAVRSRPGFQQESWLVVVSTDHGGQGTGHGGGRQIPVIRQTWFIASGNADLVGEDQPTYVVDVAATALDHLGIAANPAWRLDGKSVLSSTGKPKP
ncbi:Type I phosphodiesterase / nucleotide pyrophosphatase [Rubripirellula lacrimiformis]|uniref:Type I phosphodiesterase / nucleotide pyrophosphatase n=1 Tax=Rubripirellula lacrimiformis TaxID=1930273 RepID=A0A517NAA7_9BACT|nr:alkaline phosphatase family protein [Rubripirellula lacrimiformis]QDT04067.1 Type I phosphodiesterase / nucleotide pyrophosphatase [Rubripirellula lacrimiformis]